MVGIAGLGAAIALADIGYKVTVLERHDSLQALGSVIGIMPSGTRVLESYGVLDDVWEVCGDRSPTMIYRRWKDGNVILSQAPSERENLWGIRFVEAPHKILSLTLVVVAPVESVATFRRFCIMLL